VRPGQSSRARLLADLSQRGLKVSDGDFGPSPDRVSVGSATASSLLLRLLHRTGHCGLQLTLSRVLPLPGGERRSLWDPRRPS
jgi:hypothetical protein